jgi:addiction module HigA family antidote
MEMYNPAHPGLLIADILENGNLSIGNSVSALARHIGVPVAVLREVVACKTPVTADLALRLQDALKVDADMWLRLQAKRDLWVAKRKRRKKVNPLVSLDQAA